MPSVSEEIDAARRSGYVAGLVKAKDWVTDPAKSAEISKEIARMMKGGKMPKPASHNSP